MTDIPRETRDFFVPSSIRSQEGFGSPRRQQFPKRGDYPAGREYIIVVAFAILPIVPPGMLDDFGIIAFLRDAAEMPFEGKELPHRGADDFRKVGKARLPALACQSLQHVGEVEDKHVDMVILHGNIAPAARLQSDIAQHLSRREGYIPDVIPREGEIGSFPGHFQVMHPLLTFANQG